MTDIKEFWKKNIMEIISQKISTISSGSDPVIDLSLVTVEIPPKPELGDLAFPMFPFARILKKSPAQIAGEVSDLLNKHSGSGSARCEAAGPYVNIFLNHAELASQSLEQVETLGDKYGYTNFLAGKKIMIEFSCPNTNKPLHLGHLRNDALGESLARIQAAAGADVMKVNLINNRGVHICKSMLAYQNLEEKITPESSGKKGDHLVGDFYVKFNQWAKEDSGAEVKAQEMLVQWEKGDPDVRKLWETMNKWTLEGIQETYDRTGVSFDKVYFESDTYILGKENILKGLEDEVFYKADDGSIRLDLSEIGMDNKVLLRSDGTSVYMTQDIGTAIERHKDWPFDQLIYIVGSEQQYHFQVLFYALKKLGFSWADSLHHLSYGMVNLPEGKMKSREGTVVDADTLLDQLTALAENEIIDKNREAAVGDVRVTAEKIALGALHYYLLTATPSKDMIYNPAESLSFNGNTGPYLQYVGARIASMIRKMEGESSLYSGMKFSPELLNTDEEWELIKLISNFSQVIVQSAQDHNPSIVTSYLYELARNFSRFYHNNQVLNPEEPELSYTRMKLAKSVRQVLINAFYLINIPYLDVM